MLLVLGYLVGSISPGYFFGRIIKHIDIRKVGNGNTGATNTYYIVGPVFGILTGIFDFLKTPVVYFLAVSGILSFTVSPDLGLLVGLSVVLGHIKPFYLGFRGGKGVASLLGLCAITIFYTRSIFALIFLIGSIIYAIVVSKSLVLTHPLRQVLKLGVLVLPLGTIWLPKIFILAIALLAFLVFAVFDAIRLLNPKINKRYLNFVIFAKSKETRKPSGATLLLFSNLLILWLFPKEIAVLSLTGFILGDSLAPIGKRMLPVPLLKGKTLGGALIIFTVSAVAGLFLISLTPLHFSFLLILFAALLTAVLDQFSFLIDDNLLVPLGTTLLLTVFQF